MNRHLPAKQRAARFYRNALAVAVSLIGVLGYQCINVGILAGGVQRAFLLCPLMGAALSVSVLSEEDARAASIEEPEGPP